MLHYLRQQKQWLGMIIIPLLLTVWFSLACQTCFAASAEMSVSCNHQVNTECCSQEQAPAHSDHASCEVSHVTSQVVTVDDATLQAADYQLSDLLAVNAFAFPVSLPSVHPYFSVKAPRFTYSIFKHYRVLLI